MRERLDVDILYLHKWDMLLSLCGIVNSVMAPYQVDIPLPQHFADGPTTSPGGSALNPGIPGSPTRCHLLSWGSVGVLSSHPESLARFFSSSGEVFDCLPVGLSRTPISRSSLDVDVAINPHQPTLTGRCHVVVHQLPAHCASASCANETTALSEVKPCTVVILGEEVVSTVMLAVTKSS